MKSCSVVLHSALAKVTVECRDCNNERHTMEDFKMMNLTQSSRNASLICSRNYFKIVYLLQAVSICAWHSREAVKQPPLLKAVLLVRWRKHSFNNSECDSQTIHPKKTVRTYENTNKTRRWASAFIREKNGAAPESKISARTSQWDHPKWGSATRPILNNAELWSILNYIELGYSCCCRVPSMTKNEKF